MRRALVIGLTGQVGSALRPRIHELGEVWALSRTPPDEHDGTHWLTGILQSMPPLPEGIDTIAILSVGEAAVVVAAAAPHRAEAFTACRAAIDRLKSRAPIWKKEIGASGAEWIEHCC